MCPIVRERSLTELLVIVPLQRAIDCLIHEESRKLVKSQDVILNEAVFELTSEWPKETATVEPTDRDSSAESSIVAN